jgi:hypothetical protein
LRPVPPAPFLPPAPHPVRAGNRGHASLIASPATPAPGADANPHRGAFPRQTNAVKKPIPYDGKVYPSQAALARALGLTRSTVSFAIRHGRIDTLGTGTKSGWANVKDSRCQPVSAHGWHWPSQKAAAKALNCDEGTVSDNLNRGTFDRLVLQRLGVKA